MTSLEYEVGSPRDLLVAWLADQLPNAGAAEQDGDMFLLRKQDNHLWRIYSRKDLRLELVKLAKDRGADDKVGAAAASSLMLSAVGIGRLLNDVAKRVCERDSRIAAARRPMASYNPPRRKKS